MRIYLTQFWSAHPCESLTWRAANQDIESILYRSQVEFSNEIFRVSIDYVASFAVTCITAMEIEAVRTRSVGVEFDRGPYRESHRLKTER
uniref:Uncharacterized protein n=1 Tax=Rhizobium rhizogenes TaxID=359 RepID=A0A7S4ZT68_RHIRH|nr:hypothetical protein pC6.5c_546 [Rhizobium rhizogenes]QCO89406.1 hypothetical protein pC5.7d_690 [Rhizobium rhizogenes]